MYIITLIRIPVIVVMMAHSVFDAFIDKMAKWQSAVHNPIIWLMPSAEAKCQVLSLIHLATYLHSNPNSVSMVTTIDSIHIY